MKDNLGRMIIVLAEIQSQKLILANIYAPNLDDLFFFFSLILKGNYKPLGITLLFWEGILIF